MILSVQYNHLSYRKKCDISRGKFLQTSVMYIFEKCSFHFTLFLSLINKSRQWVNLSLLYEIIDFTNTTSMTQTNIQFICRFKFPLLVNKHSSHTHYYSLCLCLINRRFDHASSITNKMREKKIAFFSKVLAMDIGLFSVDVQASVKFMKIEQKNKRLMYMRDTGDSTHIMYCLVSNCDRSMPIY